MKKLLIAVCAFLVAFNAWANVDVSPLLNKVTLQLQAEQWVTTKTAIVTVGVNAAITDQDIGSIQSGVMDKLKQLSDKGEWHIISFNRQLDQSGLEKVQISAQARLGQSDLSDLRNKAKALSKPGETFTIDDVAFTPSAEELQQANTELRNNLYLQVSNEIAALNKMYPDQKYYLYSIDFINPPIIQPMMENMAYASKASANRAMPTPISVGNKAQLQATVIIASMPEVVLQELKQAN